MRAVLTYHSIDDSGSPVSVSEEAFRAHVRWLSSGRVRVVPLREIHPTGSHGADEDVVAITFDDALASFARIAAPILEDARLPVTVFVASDFVGRESTWAGTGGAVPAFHVMDWDELRTLSPELVEVGGHSRTHAVLTRLGDSDLDDELRGCRERIAQEIGTAPKSFAYPYGIHDDRVVDATAKVFDLAVTADLGTLGSRPDPLRLPRLDMWYYRDPERLAAWGTLGFDAHLGLRKLARRARRAFVGSSP